MLDFQNAKLLGYQCQHKYFGENLNYSVEKHLTIQGSIYALTNQSGVAPVWSGISGFVKGAIDYDAVIINGTNFGQGRVNGINFSEGNDVRKKEYSADLSIFSSGNLYNMTGADFNGLNLSGIHLVENFSENFDFSIASDGTYSYKQTVNVKYPKCDSVPNPIGAAKILASGLLFSTPSYGFIDAAHSGFYNQSGRRVYTENYNKITNECSFSENFTKPPISGSGNYSIKFTQEINTNEDGVSTVSENGHIESLGEYLPEDGFTAQKSTAYSRAAYLLSIYVPGAAGLNTNYLTLRKATNQFTNSIDYTIQYNNDPRNQNTYIWEYTEDVSKGNECYYKAKEAGRIKGISNDCSKNSLYANALGGWAAIQGGIGSRIASSYASVSHLSNPLKLISSTERKSEHAGEVTYESVYTDDLTFKNDEDIRRVETDVTDELPIPSTNRFVVAGQGEVIQDLGISKEGKRTVSVKMLGARETPLNTYLSQAVGILNSNIPGGNDSFIDGCNYSFAPLQNSFNVQVTWVYFATTAGGLTI